MVFIGRCVILIHLNSLEGNSCTLNDNAERGTCQLQAKCPYYQQRIPGRSLPKICGFKSSNLPYFCCPEIETTTKTTDDQTKMQQRSNSNERISIKKCREYLPEQQFIWYSVGGLFNKEEVTKCKDKTVPLIVGGEEANFGEFPFMAALGWEASQGYDYNCGGTLISEDFVLTAAHCGSQRGNPPSVVRLGDLNLKSSDDDANAKSIKVKRVIFHPRYTYPMHYNDIALVEMDERIPASSFNDFIRPSCLWTRTTPNFDEDKAVTIGWGDQQRAQTSDKLQKVTLELYDNSVCRKTYRAHNRTLPNGIADSMLCSGYLRGGKDSCQGDSGGPLLIKNRVGTCDYYHVIGATSFGNGCAQKFIPGVYTRVASYVDWIEPIVWPNN